MKELPSILLQQLKPIAGFDEEAFIKAHQYSAVTSIRKHPVKDKWQVNASGFDIVNNDYIVGNKVLWCEEGRYPLHRPIFTLDPAFHGGAYYVQESSSMFLDYMLRHVLKDRKDLRVLDLCAAPGGKSTLIASLLDESSLLVANEVIRSRASILEENMTRWGYMNTWVTSNDPRDFGNLQGYFDVIVIDAPCSGSGLFRKDPRVLDDWSETNVNLCSLRQQRILSDVWPSLKEDGILIYATCSYSPQENEEILDWIGDEYNVESIHIPVPENWGIVATISDKHQLCGYRFFPDKVAGEGFFISCLQKKERAASKTSIKFKTAHSNKLMQQAGHLVENVDGIYLQSGNENNHVIYAGHEPDLKLIEKTLFIRKLGIRLGIPTSKEWVPDHEVALSINISSTLPSINMSKEDALQFLKKEESRLPDIEKGWYAAVYNGIKLGWIKSLGNRFNNYLPKHWRIRMALPDDI